MIEFSQPWAAILLPLPLVLRLLWRQAAPQQTPLYFPHAVRSALAGTNGAPALKNLSRARLLMMALAWLALVAAACGPRHMADAQPTPSSGRDLMLAIDISESMLSDDMELDGHPADRLAVVRRVTREFLQRRRGDRIGLILFASNAYLHVPLTFDHATLQRLLDETRVGFAGPQTAIGDTLGLAVKRLRDRPEQARVLILLTDGANTAGSLSPRQGAELAASAGLRVYTIGIGSDPQQSSGLFGGVFGMRRPNPAADLDEDTLREIASLTGGHYFRAHDGKELEKIYAELDRLEPLEQDARYYRPQASLAHWPLALALTITLALATQLLWARRRG